MIDCIRTKKMMVTIQENGIIRNDKGRLIARFTDDIDFYGEHIVEEKMYSRSERDLDIIQALRLYDPRVSKTYTEAGLLKWIEENL